MSTYIYNGYIYVWNFIFMHSMIIYISFQHVYRLKCCSILVVLNEQWIYLDKDVCFVWDDMLQCNCIVRLIILNTDMYLLILCVLLATRREQF